MPFLMVCRQSVIHHDFADSTLGMILFPLGQPVFANLGVDGISMFYVSCIVSQLVYSLGGSIFKGGIGSEMVMPSAVKARAPLNRLRLRSSPFSTKWPS